MARSPIVQSRILKYPQGRARFGGGMERIFGLPMHGVLGYSVASMMGADFLAPVAGAGAALAMGGHVYRDKNKALGIGYRGLGGWNRFMGGTLLGAGAGAGFTGSLMVGAAASIGGGLASRISGKHIGAWAVGGGLVSTVGLLSATAGFEAQRSPEGALLGAVPGGIVGGIAGQMFGGGIGALVGATAGAVTGAAAGGEAIAPYAIPAAVAAVMGRGAWAIGKRDEGAFGKKAGEFAKSRTKAVGIGAAKGGWKLAAKHPILSIMGIQAASGILSGIGSLMAAGAKEEFDEYGNVVTMNRGMGPNYMNAGNMALASHYAYR